MRATWFSVWGLKWRHYNFSNAIGVLVRRLVVGGWDGKMDLLREVKLLDYHSLTFNQSSNHKWQQDQLGDFLNGKFVHKPHHRVDPRSAKYKEKSGRLNQTPSCINCIFAASKCQNLSQKPKIQNLFSFKQEWLWTWTEWSFQLLVPVYSWRALLSLMLNKLFYLVTPFHRELLFCL